MRITIGWLNLQWKLRRWTFLLILFLVVLYSTIILLYMEMSALSNEVDQISLHPEIRTEKKNANFPIISNKKEMSFKEPKTRKRYVEVSTVLKRTPATVRREITCEVVTNYKFPRCLKRFQELKTSWTHFCYKNIHGVTGSNCSILQYLSEVVQTCPLLPHRVESHRPITSEKIDHDNVRLTKDELLERLSNPNLSWLRQRISHMWNEWKEAGMRLKQEKYIRRRKKKKVLFYLGSMAFQPWLLRQAGHGGPLGELVQWTDLITSVYLLGHEFEIIFNSTDLRKLYDKDELNSCVPKQINPKQNYDIIFTDINGFIHISQEIGDRKSEQFRCKFRILDSFGTTAEYNYKEYTGPRPEGQSPWGQGNHFLPQFMTLYPHSPDNSFLGFVAGSKTLLKNKKNNTALIYGKVATYFKGMKDYLDVAREFFEIHATAIPYLDYIPDYVINHGPVSSKKVKELLQNAKVFLGLGFPYEGPGPLEAAAQGTIYINPRFKEPRNKLNEGFFRGKPTLRKLTSQCPYTEEFIGEPYVYTIDISNKTELRRVFKTIVERKTFESYLPAEFTHFGLAQRVHAYIEHQDFCSSTEPLWPPLTSRKVFVSKIGESCTDICRRRGLLCENTFFHSINDRQYFISENIKCKKISYSSWTHAPSYDPISLTCFLQTQVLSYSCSSDLPSVRRLCPCRDFIKEQVALCKNCL